MKKLLLTLGTLTTIAIPATTVIACGSSASTHRFDTPVLGDELNDALLMALLNDPTIGAEIKGKYFNDIDFKQAATAMLEDRVSKLANNYYQSNINKSLMLGPLTSTTYDQRLDASIDAVAQNQFYLEYTKSLIAQSPLDSQINIGNNSLISLNPKKLLQPSNISDVDKMDRNNYFVFFKSGTEWKRWQYFNENGNHNQPQIPTIEELETSQFAIVKKNGTTNVDSLPDNEITNSTKLIWLDGQTRHEDGDNFVYSLDGDTPYLMNGKIALQYRFQEYFRTQIRYATDDSKSLAKRMLALSYLESTLFNVYRNQTSDSNLPINDAYLNINSDVAQAIQSWNKSSGYQSKLKMVWSFTLSRDEVSKVWNFIKPTYIEADGRLKNPNSTSIKEIYRQIQNSTGVNVTNQSNLGSDPFFNLNGYNGIVKNDNDSIISVDGNLVIAEEAKAAIATANQPRILANNGSGFKSNINGKYDFIFVIPLYLIDLLNEKTSGYNHGLSTTIYIPKKDVKKGLDPTTVFTSFSEAQKGDSGNKFESSKIDDLNRALNNITNTHDYYIYDNMGASYTLEQWNQANNTDFSETNVWDKLASGDDKINGLQVAINNTHENTFGNIGINQPVLLKGINTLPENTNELSFSLKDNQVYVTALDSTLLGKVVPIPGAQGYYLSFDPATKEGLITINSTIDKANSELNNTTYGDRINMGQNASNPESYIHDDSVPFDYYTSGISSLDVTNLNTANKTSLLRQIESIVATDETVINRASTTIYPLFLKQEDILFNPLYESLKKYLINEGGGTSD